MFKKLLVSIPLFVTHSYLFSQTSLWKEQQSVPGDIGIRYIKPEKSATYSVDFNALKNRLRQAPVENSGRGMEIAIPRPAGGYETFEIWQYAMLEPGLQAQFPEIGTYLGRSVEVPSRTVRIDHTYQGFHAMVSGIGGSWFIDPVADRSTAYYQVYYKHDLVNDKAFYCGNTEIPAPQEEADIAKTIYPNGTQLKTYRLALAATAEYTAFHGSAANAQSAQVTTMNRVNGLYEIDVAVRMVLIANNNLLIFTNAATDGYTNDDGNTMLSENRTKINSVIGTANYDIGHVFSTGGGGVAYLGCVCTSNKACGVTGSPAPVGDPFDIDYVAHEMGHQFGGDHTFNSTFGSCGGGNRTASSAFEPGSGITIMAYAGICGADNLAGNSIANFHTRSFFQISDFITNGAGNTCDVPTNTGNAIPLVDAGPSIYRIPLGTPFRLKATGSDANATDQLTYSWEEYDLGNAVALSQNPTASTHPLLRPYSPDTSATRIFPRMQTIVNNQTDNKEKLPYYGRRLRFRVMVRDNRPNGGGASLDSTTIWAVASTGPFLVTAPNTALTWSAGSTQTVSWNVAGSNTAPINCQNVNIKLSTDGGYTYPITVLANTPNDGSQSITVPVVGPSAVTTCRIMVEAADNIFFDISNANFTIQNEAVQPPTAAFTSTAAGGTACAGSPLVFSDQSTNAPSQWSWSFEGGTPATSTVQNPTNVTFATPGAHTVTLTAGNSGGTSTVSQTLTVIAQPGGTVTAVPSNATQSNGSATVTPSGGSAPYQYQWSTSPVQTGATATNLGAGSYTVLVTDANGCTNTLAVMVPGNASVSEADVFGTRFYPNPAGEEITLSLQAEGKYTYTWYDAAGRTVGSGSFTGQTHTFALGGFSSGIYTFRISDGTSTAVKKVIRQ